MHARTAGDGTDENDASAAQRLRPISSEKGAGPASVLRSKSMEMKRKEIQRLKGALSEANAANETAFTIEETACTPVDEFCPEGSIAPLGIPSFAEGPYNLTGRIPPVRGAGGGGPTPSC